MALLLRLRALFSMSPSQGRHILSAWKHISYVSLPDILNGFSMLCGAFKCNGWKDNACALKSSPVSHTSFTWAGHPGVLTAAKVNWWPILAFVTYLKSCVSYLSWNRAPTSMFYDLQYQRYRQLSREPTERRARDRYSCICLSHMVDNVLQLHQSCGTPHTPIHWQREEAQQHPWIRD